MGRPSDFTQEVADIICDKLADGESLRSICDAEDLPSARTVHRWLVVNEGFRQQYAKAREDQADTIFDEILTIADDGRNDWMQKTFGEETRWVENGEAIQRSRLRIDARKWMAGKLLPKKYGERIQQEIGGIGGDAIKIETNDIDVARRIAFALAKGAAATDGSK